MIIKQLMTLDVRVVKPDQLICDAARIMNEFDIGAVPVGEGDRLVGVITDRDIAIRAVAQHRSPDTRVREVMSGEICYCFEDEEVQHVAKNMGDLQVRRLPVMDRNKRLVGIVSLSDIALKSDRMTAGQAVADISRVGGNHSQTTS